MNVLVWFKRELRIQDHPALVLAARTGAVLPVFVVEPELWAQPETSARQWAFVEESLADLREDLSGIGAPLVAHESGPSVELPCVVDGPPASGEQTVSASVAMSGERRTRALVAALVDVVAGSQK